jgi:hypothetical protein
MNEQGGGNQKFSNEPEEGQKGKGFTQEQVEATLLRRLEEVLAEDVPKSEESAVQTQSVDEVTSLEDLKKGLEEGDIELLSDEGGSESKLYSPEFIEGAKKALEQMLSPEDDKSEDES